MRKAETNRRRLRRIAGSYRWIAAAAITCAALSVGSAGAGRSLRDEVARALFPGSELPAETPPALRFDGEILMDGAVVGRIRTVAVRTPRRMREEIEVAGVRQVVTLLGSEAWMEDANGSVRALSGDELTKAAVSHMLLFHTYLDAHDAAGTPEPALHWDMERRRVVFSSPGRTDRVLTFDAGFLPESFRQTEAGAEITTTFDDWREIDGVRWPFLSRQSTGDPRFDMTVRTTEAAYSDTVSAESLLRPTVGTARDFEFTDPAAAADVEITLSGSLIIVPVAVNGTVGDFLLDTGAGATVLDADFATSLGLEPRGMLEARGAGGSEQAAFVDVERMTLPGLQLTGQTVVTIPLTAVGDALGRRIDGVLGYDFLSRFAVRIDYPARRLGVFPAGEYRPDAEAERLPLRIEANVPRIEGVLNGKHSGSFVLDTGNNWSVLVHSPFVRANGLEDPDGRSLPVTGVGGQEAMRATTFRSLKLGDHEFRRISGLLATAEDGAAALEGPIGNVGGALFSDLVLAFDYSAGSVWIAPSTAASASRR